MERHKQEGSLLSGRLRSLLCRRRRSPLRDSPPAAQGTDEPVGQLRDSAGRVVIVDLGGWTGGSLSNLLQQDGYEAEVVHGHEAGLGAVEQEDLVLIIVVGTVDLGFCSALRYVSAVPMLVLAPQADEAQILSAYAAGVDQYHVGPISSGEAAARARAMLRRAAWPALTS